MAKRFTSTEKWDDLWFRKLSPKHKCLWQYLCDRCDNAGVWLGDFDIASLYINDKCDESDMQVLNNGKERIKKLKNDKYMLTDFVRYQWGKNQKVITQINELLYKHGIDGVSIGYQYSIDTTKNKNKEKNKEKKQEKNSAFPSIEQVIEYCHERKNGVDPYKWHDFYTAKGWMIGKNCMKDWKAAVRTWENKDQTKKGGPNATPL